MNSAFAGPEDTVGSGLIGEQAGELLALPADTPVVALSSEQLLRAAADAISEASSDHEWAILEGVACEACP